MQKQFSVGVWGCGGFVGGTSYKVFKEVEDKLRELNSDILSVSGYDILPEKSKDSLETTAAADLVFVAVPTPMNASTGESQTEIVESVVRQIRQLRKDNLIVIKSTVPPGTTEALNKAFGNICFNPEFLTEANAYDDFVSLPYQIVGTPEAPNEIYWHVELQNLDLLEELYKLSVLTKVTNSQKIYRIPATEAEMVKYTRNCYLATRLSFFNEIKQICDKLNVKYESMAWFAGFDPRVGQHYNCVDEKNPGFGLSCLPKDLNALKYLAKQLNVDPKVLTAVWDKNLEVRKFRDWEHMEKAFKKDE